MKKIASYIVAIFIGLVIVAPPIDFDIPMMVNSHQWVFIVISSALLSFFLLNFEIHWAVKALMVYSFFSCFFRLDWVALGHETVKLTPKLISRYNERNDGYKSQTIR